MFTLCIRSYFFMVTSFVSLRLTTCSSCWFFTLSTHLNVAPHNWTMVSISTMSLWNDTQTHTHTHTHHTHTLTTHTITTHHTHLTHIHHTHTYTIHTPHTYTHTTHTPYIHHTHIHTTYTPHTYIHTPHTPHTYTVLIVVNTKLLPVHIDYLTQRYDFIIIYSMEACKLTKAERKL